MPIRRISPERRKTRRAADVRDLRTQYMLRKSPQGIEYSKDLQAWHPEGRKIKPEIRRAVETGRQIMGKSEDLFVDKGITARKRK
jgi:hypothetical protein